MVLVLSMGIALLLNSKVKRVNIFRGLFFLPVITSWVAVSMIWKGLLNPEFGIINSIIEFFGGTGPAWLQDPAFVLPSVIMVSVWKDVGFLSIIFLGGLQGISSEYYEAAQKRKKTEKQLLSMQRIQRARIIWRIWIKWWQNLKNRIRTSR